ncbi:death-associated inhibitor of apoptosis 1-like [Anopheles maculipalpis]|uniref:death-associated inhibitor of apoptosis 1-like n=1 Tax=Anopheles maculipalpis TaxID=1496333 RepID=UPI0021592349|nr:death-associated inhibitor of apoptosis 1-like [Anopheles maculipalpis]
MQDSIRESDYNKEVDRLRTFESWPLAYIQPSDLARWGFYYVRRDDVVRCYFCKIELGSWEETDVVPQEHLKWSRHCPLMTKHPTTNVPLDPNFLNQLAELVPDVTGAVDEPQWNIVEYFLGETSNNGPFANQTALQPDSVPIYRPMFPHYQGESARLLSFKEWPKAMKQTPEQLADAGFFYTGKSDIVQCFCCGSALRNWLSEDDPWTEHAANFSGCYYVKLMKSEDFIRQCQKQTTANDSSVEQAEANVVSKPNEASEDEVTDEKSCKVCYSRPYDTVFMPCGHVVACGKCASSVTKCPLCNEQYTNVVRIFLS